MIVFIDFFEQIPITWEFLLFVILNIIFLAFYHFLRIMTNKVYSPTHRIVADTLVIIYFFWVDDRGQDKTNRVGYVFIMMIAYIFVFIGCLIYHEIIILHFFHLNENTKDEIDRRAIRESKVEKEKLLLPEEDTDVLCEPKSEE